MVSCPRMIITLRVGYCKLRCAWLYCCFVSVGLCKPPLWTDFSISTPSAFIAHLCGTPFHPSVSQVIPVHPSDQISPPPVFPAPSCPFVIALTVWWSDWCLSIPHWRCVLLVFCPQCLHHKCLTELTWTWVMKRVGVFNLVDVGPNLDYAAYAQELHQ